MIAGLRRHVLMSIGEYVQLVRRRSSSSLASSTVMRPILCTLVWGEIPFLGAGLPTTGTLRAAKAAGGIAVLAHPSRKRAWQSFEPQWGDQLLGIETWNRKYDGWAPSETAPGLFGTAGGAIPFVGLDFIPDASCSD